MTPKRLLLVDDEPNVMVTLGRLLAPHEIVPCVGVRAAIAELSKDRRFDAIVCDLHMDDGTGADVYEFLAGSIPELQDRLVLMTGGAYTDALRAFLDRTRLPCLEKPFHASELLDLLVQITGR